MSWKIIHGDARQIPLKDKSVQCVVTSPRNKGQFVKGTHWRPLKPHWDKAWLETEYLGNNRSTTDIAAQMGCNDKNIQFWLKKHGIKARSVSQARKIKYWGAAGKANPMFGKYGNQNPNFVDGSSPDRQRSYAQHEGREFLKRIYKRDNYQCRRCAAPKAGPKSLHAHHIIPWAGNVELRFSEANAVTLCRKCHSWVHSKKNINGDWKGGFQYGVDNYPSGRETNSAAK
jgi:thymidylate synthase (FAD)